MKPPSTDFSIGIAGEKWFLVDNIQKPIKMPKKPLKKPPVADSFIIMQVDRAGWHRSGQLQVPENIRLIFQPPYSPEVNQVRTYLGRVA